MKFCRDCKHMLPGAHGTDQQRLEVSKCARAAAPEVFNVVTGESTGPNFSYCSVQRMDPNPCGHDGNRYEARA